MKTYVRMKKEKITDAILYFFNYKKVSISGITLTYTKKYPRNQKE